MENITLKQWVIAGTLSGAIIGIPLSLNIYLQIYDSDIFSSAILIFFIGSLLIDIFLGLVIGVILFFLRNIFLSPILRWIKYVIVSMVINAFPFLSWGLIVSVKFDGNPYAIITSPFFGPLGQILWIQSIQSLNYYYFSGYFLIEDWRITTCIIIGVIFGFLIHFFITRMEQKALKE